MVWFLEFLLGDFFTFAAEFVNYAKARDCS